MSFADLITLFRAGALPLIIFLLYQETAAASFWAIIILFLAVLSDLADEFRLRKGKITKVSSFLDPFASKLLAMGLLFVFFLRGSFWLIPLIFFILGDIIISLVRWLASQDDILLQEGKYRKAITYSQLGILFALLFQELFIYRDSFFLASEAEWPVLFFTVVSLLLTVISILHHVFVYSRGVRLRRKQGKKVENKPLIILANKKSGGYHDRYRRHLLKVFARRRQAKLIFLSSPKNIFHQIEKRVRKFPHLILAGGDGTFESALNYQPFRQKSLGFFPLGSGNAFYSYFYKGKRFEYLRSRFDFREMELDILELEWAGGKRETTFLTIGLDSEVARRRESLSPGFWGYFIASWKVACGTKIRYDLECLIDGKKHFFSNCINLALGKVPYYGFALRSLVGKTPPDDGQIHAVAIINRHSPRLNKALRFWGLLLAALNLEKAPLLAFKGKEFVIKSQTLLPIQAGGEFLGYSHYLKVRVRRKQKVLVI